MLSTLASPAWATTYYLATAAGGGSDSNTGLTSGTPWLTPKHAVNCGDVILAAPSAAYVATNFHGGDWGVVICPASNNVAWLKCATFDACKISVTDGSTYGMVVSRSYWGVQGWEISITQSSSQTVGCLFADPSVAIGQLFVHHVIIANNVMNTCAGGGGIVTNHGGSTVNGIDYVAVLGNIVYNAALGNGTNDGCFSGIDFYEPGPQLDANPGTHFYAAGNFSYANVDTSPCNTGGGVSNYPSDGEGIILDTVDNNNVNGVYTPNISYTGAVTAYNGTIALKGSVADKPGGVAGTAQCGVTNSTATCTISPTAGDVLAVYSSTAGTSVTTPTPFGCGTWSQQGSTSANGDGWWTAVATSTKACNITASGTNAVILLVYDTIQTQTSVDAGPSFGAYTFSSGYHAASPVTLTLYNDLVLSAFTINGTTNTGPITPLFRDYSGVVASTWQVGQGQSVIFPAYAQQIVIDNNIFVANGGRGEEVFLNHNGAANAPIYFRHNTTWGNQTQSSNSAVLYCSESIISSAFNTVDYLNISETNATTGCIGSGSPHPIHAFTVTSGNATDRVYSNVEWSASGYYEFTDNSGAFSFGSGNLQVDPAFANATAPGAPSCSGKINTVDCMATVIANFTPTNAAAVGYGYQKPSTTQTYDPLFPQWLCNVNLPAGLVTMGCLAKSSSTASPTITGVKVQ